jgi:hypothetical protein
MTALLSTLATACAVPQRGTLAELPPADTTYRRDGASGAGDPCVRSPVLPAYAHNDYANPRPLHEALELGFRGVEADVLLRRGELRVGHDGGQTTPGRTLEALYLQPLRGIVLQCGRVLVGPIPFLLNVELKEPSLAAYDSLLAVVIRFADLVQPAGDIRNPPPVEIILVGWHPPLPGVATGRSRLLWGQQRVTTRSPAATESTTAVRLVSLDYGKTIGWRGRGPVPTEAASWLAGLQAAKQSGPGRISRAYNVPVVEAVYRLLIEGGVDLVGTKHLRASQQMLLAIYAPQTK